MNRGLEARLCKIAAPLRMKFFSLCILGISCLAVVSLSGCKNFWAAPAGSTDFALSNGGPISVTAGATTSNTSLITVTPSNSFSGTVTLSCAVTTSVTSPVSPATCSLSPTSVSISGTTAETSTLTATTTSTTTSGAYSITVTGASTGASSETTSVCVEVGTSTGSCTSSAGGASGIFFVLNQTTNQIASLSITSSGTLTGIGTTSLPAAGASAIAVAPNGNFLYVSTGSGIFLYTIASNGTLTIGNGGQAISLDLASSMQVDATNSWLVDAVAGIAEINAIAISPTTGGLAGQTEQVFALPSTTPIQVAISPNDSSSCTSCYVFVAMGSGGTEVIHFNPASTNPFTSSVGTINPVSSEGGDSTVGVDPSNRLLYVGETAAVSGTQTGGLRVFTIASGGVTQLAGSPYASGGTGPTSILPTANGNFVYIANQSVSGSADGNITGFSVTASALTSISSIGAGPTGRLGLAEDSTGSYLLATDFAGSPDLQAYTMSGGTLTSLLTDATGTDPVGAVGIAALP